MSRRTALLGTGALGAVAVAGAIGVELEVLPGRWQLYHRLGLDGADGVVPDVEPGRMAMGGLGALHLARLLRPVRVAGVAAISAALWRDPDEAQPGAFASQADFEAVHPFGRQDELDGMAIRIDCGEGDPFYAANRDYVDGFDTRPEGGFERGDHDLGYWRRMAPAQLEFLGGLLAERG
ncbi:S-formylglutathione hydrolase FrmB [Nocardioides thalensis]|uniref:S-formylglutathione hydrolase FrmB n=1 Tax=Nocardioides thalensis TaxID=1914755 RepID=A0A853C6B8_9ACTN|nr:hypothetical protein [Nocardioides thalensis]NYJ03395.1 S-formylglutathione hydrolase FrmB [Nocardioides thalensis]